MDRASSQRVLVDAFDGEVSGADRVLNDTAAFGRLDFVQFERPLDPLAGRFLHFVLARRGFIKHTMMMLYSW